MLRCFPTSFHLQQHFWYIVNIGHAKKRKKDIYIMLKTHGGQRVPLTVQLARATVNRADQKYIVHAGKVHLEPVTSSWRARWGSRACSWAGVVSGRRRWYCQAAWWSSDCCRIYSPQGCPSAGQSSRCWCCLLHTHTCVNIGYIYICSKMVISVDLFFVSGTWFTIRESDVCH